MFFGRTPRLYTTVPFWAFLALLFISTGFASAQDDELKALFDQGKTAFYKAEYNDALQAFQAILAENPSDELAFYFWEEAGHKIFLEMLIKEGEFETVARRFIEKATVGRKMKQSDGARIQELADMIVSGDHRQRREALLELSANHGEYAVEYLYKELGNQDVEARVNVIAALFRMGEEVTLPLIQVLGIDDENIQRNAAVVLGRIGDERAVPALSKLYSSPDAAQTVKDMADEAIIQITGRGASDLLDASALFCGLAEAYLTGADRICKPYLASSVVWQLRNGELTQIPVGAGFRDLELAEDACYSAMACDSGSTKALSLLAVVYASQLAEANAMVPDEDEDEGTTFARENAKKADTLLALCGPDMLQAALSIALEHKQGLAALEIIKAMADTGNFSTQALRLALNFNDKLVRYAGAFAAIQSGIVDRDVVYTAANALGENAVKQVLVIDDNAETNNALLTGLNGAGFFAVGARSGAVGLARAKDFPPKDLVIVRANLKDMTVDAIVYEMASGMSADTPILLLASADAIDGLKTLWEGKVAGFLSGSGIAGGNFLATVNDAAADLNDSRKNSLALATKAAESLALLNGAILQDVREDLIRALQRDDSVRIPALAGLAKIGDRNALEAVAQIYTDTSAAVEVRVAAAKALGAIFKAGDVVPDGDLSEALKAALTSDDASLRMASAEALGKAVGLDDAAVVEILSACRI
jgi:HEAT repeat protein